MPSAVPPNSPAAADRQALINH